MPNFKKSRGFKMSGYTYAGQSPLLKGAKSDAQKQRALAASDKAKTAWDNPSGTGYTDLMSAQNASSVTPPATPMYSKTPMKENVVGRDKSDYSAEIREEQDNLDSNNNETPPDNTQTTEAPGWKAGLAKAGQAGLEAGISAAIGVGMEALFRPKEKEERVKGGGEALSRMKFGSSTKIV